MKNNNIPANMIHIKIAKAMTENRKRELRGMEIFLDLLQQYKPSNEYDDKCFNDFIWSLLTKVRRIK